MIPAQAKRVFKGVIFDVYQWEQEMFDGSQATFERLRRADAVNIIAVKGGEIVLGEEMQPTDTQPFYTLFGGAQDTGEEPLDAAKRELLEESGLVSDTWELWTNHRFSDKIDWTVHVFIAKDCRVFEKQRLDAGEKITVKTVSFDAFLEKIKDPGFRNKGVALDILRMMVNDELEAFKERIGVK